MTKLVADKTPSPFQTSRRHIDPPGLWIAVVTGSVTLHLLVFWLMRSHQINFLREQYSSTDVPIEVVEIDPPQAKAKPGFTKSPSTLSTQPAKPALTNEDKSAIALGERQDNSSQPNSPIPRQRRVQQKTAPKPPESTPQAINNRQPVIPPPPQPPSETNASTPKRENLVSSQQNQASPSPNTTDPSNTTSQTGSPSFTNEQQKQPLLPESSGEQIAQAPQNQIGEIPDTNNPPPQQKPPQPLPEQIPESIKNKPVPSPTGGGLVANWNTINRNDVTELIQQGILKQDIPPKQLAEHIGSKTKEFASLEINAVLELEPVNLLASLIVDDTGNFQGGYVIGEIVPPNKLEDISPEKKSTYENFLNDFFQNEKFRPAQNDDGSKPPQSNLVVQIKIQRR